MPTRPVLDVPENSFGVRRSGDGYELLDGDRKVIAWTLDLIWALRIVMALESERTERKCRDEECEPEPRAWLHEGHLSQLER